LSAEFDKKLDKELETSDDDEKDDKKDDKPKFDINSPEAIAARKKRME